jgi:hypothetical protein
MERVLRTAGSTEVSAEVQQDSFYRAGSGIEAEQQCFHLISPNKAY